MAKLEIRIGAFVFDARWEDSDAPNTVAAIRKLLPFRARAIHARWSGEAAWAPIDDVPLQIPYENHTSHPAPGELLLYPGGFSEREILIPYGAAAFASKLGQLAGNHFATLIAEREQLRQMGKTVLWEGAQDFEIREV